MTGTSPHQADHPPVPDRTDRDRVAVIGMALRLPGSDRRSGYWRTIREGRVHIRRFTRPELTAAGVAEELVDADDFVGASAQLPEIAGFDAPFFSMSGQEAGFTDPQHRMFLEVAHHALEDAGYAGEQPGLRTGVYASSGYHLYSLRSYLHSNLLGGPVEEGWMPRLHRNIGGSTDFMATRTAFRLGLVGPALSVQNACSSSLVALHLARQSLLTGDSDIALAGASAVHLPQILGYRYTRGSVLSRSGRCRPFDAASDGTVGGNGVAAVVLKRLDRALADRDTVHGVILGSAVNNDGSAKKHFTEPSVAGQSAVIRQALAAAGVSPDTIGYLETHGTGTYKGDPMEFRALRTVFREHTDRTGFCALGAGKANVGHLDVLSGLAGLIRATLVLRHGTIPPVAGLTEPNPLLELEGSPFYLPREATRWPGAGPRRAGVTSLGVGGTNAHVILEGPPGRRDRPNPPEQRADAVTLTGAHPRAAGGFSPTGDAPSGPPLRAGTPSAVTPPCALVPLSAQNRSALLAGARRLRRHLALHPVIEHADVVTTLAHGRRHLRHRLVLAGRSPGELRQALDDFLETSPEDAAEPLVTARWTAGVVPRTRLRRVAWLFEGGSGPRLQGAARELYEQVLTAREALDTCELSYRDATGRSLLATLVEGEPSTGAPADRAALFALQAAQARTWRRLGSPPALVVAADPESEYAALLAAGALGLAEGVLLAGDGGAAPASATGREISVPFFRAADGTRHEPGRHPALSALVSHRGASPARTADPERVAEEIKGAGCGLVQEIGPGTSTDASDAGPGDASAGGSDSGPGGTSKSTSDPDIVLLAAPRPGSALREMWQAAAELYCRGHPLEWTALTEGHPGGRVPLPGYAFQHRTYWTGPELVETRTDSAPPPSDHEQPAATERDIVRDVQDILARVVALTATHLECDQADIDAEVPFFDLGADSLRMINMVQDLEREYQVKISMRELFEEADTPLLVAELVAARGGTATSPDARRRGPAPAEATPQAAPPSQTAAEPPHEPAAVTAPTPAAVPAAPEPSALPASPQAAVVATDAPAPAPGNDWATQQSVDALTEQVRQLTESQMQLMRQFSQLLEARFTTSSSAPSGSEGTAS